jgi:predicted transposase/invertase (TIGR01784 family)
MATKQHIRFDWAMKKLLRQKANFEVLEGFLSELLKEDVSIQSIEEGESNQTNQNDKFNRVDIVALNSKKELVLIEIQTSYEPDYLLRMLYGVSKAIVDHMVLGYAYRKVKKIYSIHIVYFELGQGIDYIYHGTVSFKGIHQHDTLQLTDRQKKYFNYEDIGKLYPEYYILKVNDFNDQAVNTLDQWIYFLKNNTIPDNFDAKGLPTARKTLQFDQMTNEDRKKYLAFLSFTQSEEQNYLGGLLDGREETQKEFVRKSFKKGLTIDTICDITELNEEQVRNIIAQAD